jgi:hypothetical protein
MGGVELGIILNVWITFTELITLRRCSLDDRSDMRPHFRQDKHQMFILIFHINNHYSITTVLYRTSWCTFFRAVTYFHSLSILQYIVSKHLKEETHLKVKKGKLSLTQGVEAHRIVRRRGSHILVKIGSQMAVRMSALRARLPPFTPRKIPGTNFC